MSTTTTRALALVWSLAGLFMSGCEKPLKREEGAPLNLRKIAEAYDIAEYKLHRAPNNMEELRRFLGETGIDGDPEQVLRSPRDGEAFVIHYGARLDPAGKDVLAHEKNGAEGGRYVITLSRDIRLLPDAEFAQATFAKGAGAGRRKRADGKP